MRVIITQPKRYMGIYLCNCDVMKRIYAIALLLVFVWSFSGCEIDSGENFHFKALEIIEADVPENFVLNQSHNIPVTFIRPDDCTFFQGFDVASEAGGIRTIVAIGSVLTEEDCNESEESVSETFTINAIVGGTYSLRFYTGDDANGNPIYLEYEVPVMENK